VKTEKMRGHGKCLRAEMFHKGGMAAISGKIQAYEIGVEWQLPTDERYTPRLLLHIAGAYRLTYEKNPVVEEAQVDGGALFTDLQFVLGKIKEYLPAAA
jgi:hypothetical protein